MTGKRVAGSALIELLIASGVFLVGTLSLFTLVLGSGPLILETTRNKQATDYAREGIEIARLIRDQNWDGLKSGTYGLEFVNGNWTLSGASSQSDTFTRSITIAEVSAYSKRVTSTVSWVPGGNRNATISLETLITNWHSTQQENYIAGDWVHPLSAASADIDSGAAGTDVFVENQKAYVSSQSTNVTKVDFSTFAVQNPSSPTLVSSVDLGISNVASIAKNGNYVYGSVADSTKEFVIIDISNPAAPIKVGDVDVSNGKTRSITVSGNRLYLGMERIAGESEFYIYDVTAPTSPVKLGSFEIDGTVNSIAVLNGRAYLATSHDTAELMILNVADPAAIAVLGTYDAPDVYDGMNVSVKDEFNIYLGRANSPTQPEFLILSATNPVSPTVQGTFDLNTGINDMVIVNRLAFLATELPNAEFKVLDVANPAQISAYSSLNFPQSVTGIAYENNTIYCSVRSNGALRVITPS
ncbi:MAG TPA: hypothetical protein VGE59_03010 [Patescibacteria group bacterium]